MIPLVRLTNTTTFTATTLDQFGNPIAAAVTWNSSNTTVGTINAAGVFTASAPGTTTITATSGAVSGTATVNVTAPITGLASFDSNSNHLIDRPEAVNAVVQFFSGDPAVSRALAVQVVVAFFSQTPV